MARKVETFALDGEHYRVTQLGAVDGRRLIVRLIKTMAPLLRGVEMAGAKPTPQGVLSRVLETSDGKVFGAVADFLQEFDGAFFEELCEKFASATEVRVTDGSTERWPTLSTTVFDEHFAGRYGLMLRWFVRCLALNGADFLSAFSSMSRPSPGAAAPSA
jgi:hypothetical protein